MDYKEIISQLPYSKPFLFVDELEEVTEKGVKGSFTFRKDLDFYQGHFREEPVTPGVILIECCAQIGLVCLGIHLTEKTSEKSTSARSVAMSRSEMEFYLPVLPGEKVRVQSEMIYYRFKKLKCAVKMYNQKNEMVCKGVLEGMLILNDGA